MELPEPIYLSSTAATMCIALAEQVRCRDSCQATFPCGMWLWCGIRGYYGQWHPCVAFDGVLRAYHATGAGARWLIGNPFRCYDFFVLPQLYRTTTSQSPLAVV